MFFFFRTIEALGYHMVYDKPPTRLRPVRLAQNYAQANGFKPQPLDTHEIVLPATMQPLVESLARNTHNVGRALIRRICAEVQQQKTGFKNVLGLGK